ncbi:MAG TPA: class I SAM-dependent methyltransferase [Candidatus Nitrosocosmicus sp.]
MGQEIWNKIYRSDNSFFGAEPSNFAIHSFNHLKTDRINSSDIINKKKMLELGAGHGRDSIFFASSGITVEALDYSIEAVNILNKISNEKNLPIKSQIFDIRNKPLPFSDAYFDVVYSHMFLNMHFSEENLHFILSEIRRVVKPTEWNFFSVRNQHDKFYGKGQEVEKGIYDINGFHIRFFTEKEIRDLASSEGFKILQIKGEYEEPVNLFLVTTRKL